MDTYFFVFNLLNWFDVEEKSLEVYLFAKSEKCRNNEA